MKTYHYKSHAKINLTLEVIKKLPNGYHELRTVMMQLPHLFDDIDVTFSNAHHDIRIVCDDSAVPTDERNICHKVVRAYCERAGKNIGMDLMLTKRIPAAAGMGGGSSNGAQILLCLNAYFDNVLSRQELIDVAASVGKDIPFFFVQSGCALIEGMGEIISKEFALPQKHILVVNPRIEISTPWAFGALAKYLWFLTDCERMDRSQGMIDILVSTGDVSSHLYNDFEIAIFAHHPVIAEIKQSLIAFGASNALMSGSGSTVFAVFDTKEKLDFVKEKMQKHYPQFFIAEG